MMIINIYGTNTLRNIAIAQKMDFLKNIQVSCINTINGNEIPLWMIKTSKYLKKCM